jgi:hypothetical protein
MRMLAHLPQEIMLREKELNTPRNLGDQRGMKEQQEKPEKRQKE